ncbi:MAG: hypothetical protein U0931_41565 [Vulcanimicrobiota bacterium]
MKSIVTFLMLSLAAWAGPGEEVQTFLDGQLASISAGRAQKYMDEHKSFFTAEAWKHLKSYPWGDPLSDSQIGFRSSKVGKVELKNERADVKVVFNIRGKLYTNAIFKLLRSGKNWAVSDILYSGGGSLLDPRD